MAGTKKINSDLDLQGKAIISTVPNSTGTVVTWNPTSKEIGTRSNADIISDLGLITATNIAAAYYTKTQLQTSGQSEVSWGNLTDVPTSFPATAHNHDDRYYTETESDNRFVHQNADEQMYGIKRTNSSFIREGDNIRIVKNPKAYYYNGTPLIGAFVIELPSLSGSYLIDIELSYQTSTSNNSQGKFRITGYFSSGSFNATINKTATVIGNSSLLPFISTIRLGTKAPNKPVIILGNETTNLGSYLSMVIESVTYRYGNVTVPTFDSNYVILGGVTDLTPYTGLTTCSVELNTPHVNRSFLDVINQNLGTTHTPTFNGSTLTGQLNIDLGTAISEPLKFKSSGVESRIGSLNSSYLHIFTNATLGTYFYKDITTAGKLIAAGGNSTQWNTAFGWGNFRDYGLGNISARSIDQLGGTNNDWNTLPHTLNGFVFGSSNSLNYPGSGAEYPVGIKIGFNQNIGATILVGRGSIPELRFRPDNSTNSYPWARVWHDVNLPNPATETWVNQQINNISIPTVNNGTLTLSTGTGLSGSANFTANQSGNITFDVSVASTHKLPTVAEFDNTLKKNESNTVTEDFEITNGYAKIKVGNYGVIYGEIEGVSNVSLGSDDGYAIGYYMNNGDFFEANLNGIFGNTNSKSWYFDNNNGVISLMIMPETGNINRVLTTGAKIGVTTYYANNQGVIELPTFTDAITTISRNGVNIPIVSQNVDIPVFSTSGAGLVPARVGATTTKYLREDGTWTVPPNDNTTYNAGTKTEITTNNTNTRVWSGAVLNTMFTDYMPTTHAANGITAANITAWNNKYTLPTGGTTSQYINGLGNLATFPTISVYNGIGPGLVPARGAGGTTTKFLNETGSWVVPPNTTYSTGTVSNIENGDTTAKIWTGETIHEYVLSNYIEKTHAANNITSALIDNWNEAYGWGSHITAGYALANGSNASGAWANSSNGLENNPTLPGKTMNGSVTSSLQNANNGTIAGYLNSAGTAAGNPDANWWYRIKMLHANPAGYNGEIALQMTGGNSLRYRKTENGYYGGWIETVDQYNVIAVGGKKMFNTTGNNFTDIPLEAYSDTAASPAIAFHKAGVHAGSIAMINSSLFRFRDLAGTGLVDTQVSVSYASNGFVHNGHNSPDKVLVSDGGAIHKKDLILPKVVQTTQDFEYLDLTVNLEFREYQVIIWNDAATINIPAASSAIMGMKIVIKLVESTTIYYGYPILEVDGNQWGTIFNDHKVGVELVCRGDSWVSTLIGQTTEIVL